MHRRLCVPLLPVLLVVLVSTTCVSSVGMPKNLRLSALSECRVGGAKFRGLGHYINGKRLEPGSIYADCVYGIATCYQDDGTTKKEEHQQVHCAMVQDHPPAFGACRIGDIEFNGYAHPIVGKILTPGSVYADCINGKPKCFVDDGIRDEMDPEVPCDEVDIEKRRRQLGMFETKEKGHTPWPDRVVCYRVDDGFPQPGLEMFERGIREFQEKAKITWIKLDECKSTYGEDTNVCLGCKISVLVSNKKPGCYTAEGVRLDVYHVFEMNLGEGCQVYDTYLHEMGHAIGLLHEQNHPDRQVVMLRNKLRMGSINYVKLYDTGRAKYDMGSIMHYDGYDMCIPKDPTLKFCDVEEAEGTNGCIEPKDEHCDLARQNDFGQAKDLAPSDVESIELWYAGINPHPKSPQFGTGAVSPSPSPPAASETTAPPPPNTTPPTTTAPPSTETPPPTTTVPPVPDATPPKVATAPPSTTPPTPATSTPTPTPPTIPGINFGNIYDVLGKLSDLLSRRSRRLRH